MKILVHSSVAERSRGPGVLMMGSDLLNWGVLTAKPCQGSVIGLQRFKVVERLTLLGRLIYNADGWIDPML